MDKISQQKSLVKGKINALSAKPPSEPLTSKFCQLLGAQDFIQPDDLSTLNSRFRGPKNGVHRKVSFKDINIEKFNILTEYNKNRLQKKIGFMAQPLLQTLQAMPLSLTTNFWGSCKK